MNYFKLFATLVKAMVKSLSTRQYVLTFEKESDNLWYIKSLGLDIIITCRWLQELTICWRLSSLDWSLYVYLTNRKNLQISVLPDNITESLVVLLTRFPIQRDSQRRFGFARLHCSYLVNTQNEFISLTLRSNIVHKQERIVCYVYLSRDSGINR